MITKHDAEELYCRKLGHKLSFKYCRIEKGDLPCSSIRNCWFEKIDVDNFLSANYSKDDQEIVFKPSSPKVYSILDIIEKAKKS